MKEYKAYIFDMDLTLLDTIESASEAYTACFEAIGQKCDLSTITHHLSIPLIDSFNEIEGHENLSFETFVEVFRQTSIVSFAKAKLYEDSLRIIDYLISKNKKLGIVTNREYHNVLSVTDKTNLTNKFSSIITCDKVSKLKPNAEPILKALEELGLNKEDCVYIGDAKNDCMAAKAAGVDFIAVERYNNCNFECDIKIHSLDELIK